MKKFFKQLDLYYFITLLFLLLSASASILSSSNIAWFISLGFMCIIALSKKLLSTKELKVISIFSVVFLLFVTARDIGVNALGSQFLISDITFLFKFVFISFVFCTILKDKAAGYLIRVTTHLTVLSFFFYAMQIVGLGDYLYKFSITLNLKADIDFPGYTNFLLFTFVRGHHEYRNSGFAWEPGAFGCFLIITLMLNLFLNKFKFDRNAKIMIVGILTTLSTTNYLALLILLFCVYRIKLPKVNIWAIFLVIMAGVVFVYIPILGDKILGTYYEDLDDLGRLKTLEIFYRHSNMQIPLNRFASMIYIYQSFGWQLILGVSNKYDVILNSKFDINISNGIFDFLAKFGLVGLVYVVYRYSKFCIKYVFKVEYLIYCIITLLAIGFGEPMMFLPIVLMFIFLNPEQKILPKHWQTAKRGVQSNPN
jgi:hypothetical protein